MGNRDIWKISLRPSNTSSYQGNMYILIATESARNPVKKGAKVWSGFAFTFSFRNVFFLHLSDHPNCSNRPWSGFLALQGSLKCHGIAVKTTTMTVVQLPKSLENRSTTTPLVSKPGPPCLCWTSRKFFFVTRINKTRSCWSHEALTRCTLDSTTTILLSAARIRKDDVCSLKSTSRQTFMRRKWSTMPLATMCYRNYTSAKSLDSVAIANKENAQSPSDHWTTQ